MCHSHFSEMNYSFSQSLAGSFGSGSGTQPTTAVLTDAPDTKPLIPMNSFFRPPELLPAEKLKLGFAPLFVCEVIDREPPKVRLMSGSPRPISCYQDVAAQSGYKYSIDPATIQTIELAKDFIS